MRKTAYQLQSRFGRKAAPYPANFLKLTQSAPAQEPRESIPAHQFRQAFADWLDDNEVRQLSPATRTVRAYLLSRMASFFESQGYSEIGVAETRAFFSDLSQTGHGHSRTSQAGSAGKAAPTKIKPASVKTYMDHLRPFWKFLVLERYLEVSPMDRIAPPPVRKSQKQPFSHEQIAQLIEAARKTSNPTRDECIVKFLLDTGVRESECCSIRLSDIDRSARTVRIINGKGNKERLVCYGVGTSRMIWRYLREGRPDLGSVGAASQQDLSQHDEPLFCSDRGATAHQALTPSGLRQMVERLGQAAGIHHISCSPHRFRHTFGVEMCRNGVNLFALQMLMGHTRIEQTREYAAIAEADTTRAHRNASPVDRMATGKPRTNARAD